MSPTDMHVSLANLSISPASPNAKDTLPKTPPTATAAASSKRGGKPLLDSWEDAPSDDDEGGGPPDTPGATPTVPPPTPTAARPTASHDIPPLWDAAPASGATPSGPRGLRTERPEKTDAVAKRLIAGALGVRAPKKTDEQREYERATREKEARRREREREEARRRAEEESRAKAAAWED
ncbi:MAG: hypothetical protein M1832_004897 [Thelocarpon impressellum]|nr:MAG: hypothetical protein M1832_004897 [Thelocarpon impressellum]